MTRLGYRTESDFILKIHRAPEFHHDHSEIKNSPPSRSDTIWAELDHVTEWAARCNLSLNQKKTQEMLIRRPRERGGTGSNPWGSARTP